MSRQINVAGIQCSLVGSRQENVDKIVSYVEEAAGQGADIVLPPELFEGPYFCKEMKDCFFDWAQPITENTTIKILQDIARSKKVHIPVSVFERDGGKFFNSIAMISKAGEILGVYRKSHIPDGPGYEEKYYFSPGDTGFKVWDLGFATIGVGICWDQWFPECARAMTLLGAEVLFYPTAIGSEPQDKSFDTKDMWQRVMIGHAVANSIPVVAANRIGDEDGQVFYGHSFICNERGEFVQELNRTETGLISATFDLDELAQFREVFGLIRDRRASLYGDLLK